MPDDPTPLDDARAERVVEDPADWLSAGEMELLAREAAEDARLITGTVGDLRDLKADAWDEGWRAGRLGGVLTNPYRMEGDDA